MGEALDNIPVDLKLGSGRCSLVHQQPLHEAVFAVHTPHVVWLTLTAWMAPNLPAFASLPLTALLMVANTTRQLEQAVMLEDTKRQVGTVSLTVVCRLLDA
eukprot:NODE_8078_length_425_cov_33.031915_g7216_i0.p2 GENE.NODE_8078_length_425_cov_33.031915_g7216_i0~~NODE_8078_length_425_cov_33.031915_g7216_i0.p2  ORF type:complete len:111 (-),score=26.25 NODE_8078_length_425_cov_33.031915_g7216_i0:93-395(-)